MVAATRQLQRRDTLKHTRVPNAWDRVYTKAKVASAAIELDKDVIEILSETVGRSLRSKSSPSVLTTCLKCAITADPLGSPTKSIMEKLCAGPFHQESVRVAIARLLAHIVSQPDAHVAPPSYSKQQVFDKVSEWASKDGIENKLVTLFFNRVSLSSVFDEDTKLSIIQKLFDVRTTILQSATLSKRVYGEYKRAIYNIIDSVCKEASSSCKHAQERYAMLVSVVEKMFVQSIVKLPDDESGSEDSEDSEDSEESNCEPDDIVQWVNLPTSAHNSIISEMRKLRSEQDSVQFNLSVVRHMLNTIGSIELDKCDEDAIETMVPTLQAMWEVMPTLSRVECMETIFARIVRIFSNREVSETATVALAGLWSHILQSIIHMSTDLNITVDLRDECSDYIQNIGNVRVPSSLWGSLLTQSDCGIILPMLRYQISFLACTTCNPVIESESVRLYTDQLVCVVSKLLDTGVTRLQVGNTTGSHKVASTITSAAETYWSESLASDTLNKRQGVVAVLLKAAFLTKERRPWTPSYNDDEEARARAIALAKRAHLHYLAKQIVEYQ